MRQFDIHSTELNLRHPRCPACGVPMWLTEIETQLSDPGQAKCTFECKACGGSVTEMVERI
jgi:hypothetical protein